MTLDYSIAMDYADKFATAEILPARLDEVRTSAARIIFNKRQYDAVSEKTSVPWFVIGCIHCLETNLSFQEHLHNGDSLTKRTVHVPKGRPVLGNPPFTWIESAVDALNLKSHPKEWGLPQTLFFLEGYNGFGYRIYHPDINTPYLWAYTNMYSSGKYRSDGVFDPSAVSNQPGAVALLKGLNIQFSDTHEKKVS